MPLKHILGRVYVYVGPTLNDKSEDKSSDKTVRNFFLKCGVHVGAVINDEPCHIFY